MKDSPRKKRPISSTPASRISRVIRWNSLKSISPAGWEGRDRRAQNEQR